MALQWDVELLNVIFFAVHMLTMHLIFVTVYMLLGKAILFFLMGT